MQAQTPMTILAMTKFKPTDSGRLARTCQKATESKTLKKTIETNRDPPLYITNFTNMVTACMTQQSAMEYTSQCFQKVCDKVKAAEGFMKTTRLVAHLTHSINIACKLHITETLHRANNRSALSVGVCNVKSSSSEWASCSSPRVSAARKHCQNIDIPRRKLQKQQQPQMHSW